MQTKLLTETHSRSLAKALSYRLFSSCVTGTIVFGLTRQSNLAVSVAASDLMVKIFTYFLHERVWAFISFGRVEPQREILPANQALTEITEG